MRPRRRTVEQELGRIAGAAHGVVTRRQALSAGITVAEIKHRLRTGALLRVHRGVYRVGHRAPSLEAGYLEAVLACGQGALLSGPAAGHLLGLLKGAPPVPEVTTRTERRVAGVVTRRSRRIGPRHATIWRGVPVTRPARTLVDLAATLDADGLARACHEAGVRHGTTPTQVEAVLDRRPASPGARKLRRILRGEAHITLSPLERGFLALLTNAGLALPQTNRPVGGRRVDCRWPEHRLTVELDGYRYHSSRHAWEQDRRRERDANSRRRVSPLHLWRRLRRFQPHAVRIACASPCAPSCPGVTARPQSRTAAGEAVRCRPRWRRLTPRRHAASASATARSPCTGTWR